jgi:hypothetical protein
VRYRGGRFWADELVRQALMIALVMIMSDEVLNGCPQPLLAEEDHAIQEQDSLSSAFWAKPTMALSSSSRSKPKSRQVQDGANGDLRHCFLI